MNLHDWIDELCDALDIEVDVDEALVLDLARVSAHNVERKAAPITAFLLGWAAGAADANQEQLEEFAASAQDLAERWDKPSSATEPDDDVPDDSGVDHSGEEFDD